MQYFNDIFFIAGSTHPRCRVHIDQCFPKTYSIQFSLGGHLYLGMDKGRQTTFRGPVFFWQHPRHSYQYGPVGNESWHHFWLTFSGDRARTILERGFMSLSAQGYAQVKNPLEIKELFLRLLENLQRRNPLNHSQMVLDLEHILLLLFQENQQSSESFAPEAKIRRFSKHLSENPLKDYDFQAAAKEASLSYSHFRALFRETIGCSPHQHLLQQRMQKAADLLSHQTHPIKEIAAMVGYPDPAQFTKVFQKKMGLSPSMYRKSLIPES
jgi:AraC-like DNA-binding protein